jgi:uncharacterized protein YggE
MNSTPYKIALLSIFLILMAVAIYVFRPVGNNRTRVTVVGDSQTKIAPDTAVITFSVVTQNAQALNAQQENARKSEAVKAAVESATQNTRTDIKTSEYNLSPQRDYSSDKVPKILGYEVKNTVTILINDLSLVGAVIDAATKAGANSVDGISFVVREDSPTQGDALALATKQAMAKAEAIANSMNGHIVRVIESREGGAPDIPDREPNTYASSNTTMNKSYVRTPVQAGQLSVRAQVILVVEVAIG